MQIKAKDPSDTVLRRVGVPEEEIAAILEASPGGAVPLTWLALITAVAIVGTVALIASVQGSVEMRLQTLRIAGRPVIFYAASFWWSAVPLFAASVFGIGYAVHVLVRLRPRLEESVTAASLQFQTSGPRRRAGRAYEWLLRRTVRCAIANRNQNRTFLQRGNDCTRRAYLVLFIIFLIPAAWCMRNDLAVYDLVALEGVEYASWTSRKPRAVPWREVQKLTVECDSAGHGNFHLRFAIGISSDDGTHRISFNELFQPLRKFLRDGKLEIGPATSKWRDESIARFDALSSWYQRVAGQGVAIERKSGAECRDIVAEGVTTLPRYYGPLALMLGVGR
jgi:hypothetical protein